MPYGTDISCVDDIDSSLSLVDDNLGLAQSIARRIITTRGAGRLWGDAPYGTDVRRWIGTCDAEAQLPAITAAVRAEALKDERVTDCIVDASFDAETKTISFTFLIIPQAPSTAFRFTLEVSELTAELLMEAA